MRLDLVIIGGVFREVLLRKDGRHLRMGGSGLTSALVASQLDVAVQLVGYVGADDDEAVSSMLAVAGVQGSLVTTQGASGTFVFPVPSDPESRPWPMFRPSEGTATHRPLVPQAGVYLAFGMPEHDPVSEDLLGGIPAESILIWDRQGWLSRTRDYRSVAPIETREKVYLANLDEAIDEFDVTTLDSVLERLPPPGFESAILKQGADGCLVVETGGEEGPITTRVPAFTIDTEVTIGSGDAFAGALAARLARGDSLVTATYVAAAAAASLLEVGGDALDPSIADRVRGRL